MAGCDLCPSKSDKEAREVWIKALKNFKDRLNAKKYQVVCYMRVDPEKIEAMSYDEALKEKEHLGFLQPENIYRVERIEDES